MNLSNGFKQQLDLLIDKEWPKLRYQHDLLVKDPSDKKYPQYKEIRDKYFQLTGIATIVDNPTRDEMLEKWSSLQEFMIGYVKEGLASKRKETSVDLSLEKDVVIELEGINAKVMEGFKELQALMTDPNKLSQVAEKSAALSRERQRINDLPQHRKKVQKLEGILSCFDSLFAQCNQVIEMTNLGRINYVILGPDEILQGIQEETFKGFPYEPFEVFPGSAMSSESIKAVVKAVSNSSSVSRQNFPIQLRNVLEIKDIVDAYTSGNKIKSDDIKEKLRQDHPYGVKMVGGYLRNNEDLFGVQWINDVAPPYFKKTKDTKLSDDDFLSRLKLDVAERRIMDKAMITATINEMRAKGEYDKFESDTILQKLREKGYTSININSIGVYLGRSGDELSVRTCEKIGSTNYFEITDIVVTEQHRTALLKAFEEFGYAEFSEEEWRLRAGNNTFIHPRVMKELLKELPATIERLDADGKIKYRSKERPTTVDQQLAEIKADANMDDPF